MHTKLRYSFYLLSFLLFNACVEIPTTGAKQEIVFFDLKEYFKKEIGKLSSLKKVKKTVSINGVKEELTIDSVNFEEELSVFINSDINRVAWFDKYQVDSTLNSNGILESITYTALDNNLKTQSIVIKFNDNTVVSQLSIKNNRSSIVSNASQDLEYLPGKSYTIQSRQNTSLSNERILKVEVALTQ